MAEVHANVYIPHLSTSTASDIECQLPAAWIPSDSKELKRFVMMKVYHEVM
jgi:hypothetical protein